MLLRNGKYCDDNQFPGNSLNICGFDVTNVAQWYQSLQNLLRNDQTLTTIAKAKCKKFREIGRTELVIDF